MSSEDKTGGIHMGSWLEAIINRALSEDREALGALCKYQGKIIAIELINTAAVFYIVINDDGISLMMTSPGQHDVLIRATPVALLEYILAASRNDGTVSGKMEIRGDIGLAQKIQVIFNNLELDWEEQLSRWTGDTIARKAGRLLSFSADTFRGLKKSVRMNASEYLLYESETVITSAELEGFYQEVDRVRDGMERLRTRLERLQHSMEGK